MKFYKGTHMLFLLVLACSTEPTEPEETNTKNLEFTSTIEQDQITTSFEGSSETNNENSINDDGTNQPPTQEVSSNTIPELPPEILETMTEKEKRVYYAMIFGKDNMPTNKTIYDEENPILTPDRDLYIPPSRKSLIKAQKKEQTFQTEGFSETFFFDAFNSRIYGIIRQNRNNVFAQKDDMIVLADSWKGIVRWHPTQLSQCILEFQIPIRGLQLDPIDLRQQLGYTTHPYEWHTSQLQQTIPTSSQIDALQHPQITFISTHCSENTQKKKVPSTDAERTHNILFHGYLQMNGIEKEINIKGKVIEKIIHHPDNSTKSTHNYESELEISGVFHFNHSDFEIPMYTNPFLLVANSDLITVHYKLSGSNE